MGTQLHLTKKGKQPPIFSRCLLWPNGWMEPLGTEVDLSPGDIVLDGNPACPKGGHSTPQFWPTCCGQMAAWIKMPLGTEVGLSLRNNVLDGDPVPPFLKGHSPQFLANAWTKMPLGMEIGLGPDDFVFDGTLLPQKKRPHPPHPIFGPCLL